MSQQMNASGAEKHAAQGDAAIVDKEAVSTTCSFFISFMLFTYLFVFHF